MSGAMWWLRTDQECEAFNQHVSMSRLAGQKLRVKFIDQDRTLDQNALSHALYAQIASQCDDQSINDIRAECKLVVGIGLLRASDDDFRAFYDSGLKQLTYEQKLDAMTFIPVTSLMGKKVFTQYLDDVIRRYTQRGISLTMPGGAA